MSQPLDEAAEARRVGGELADGVGAVGGRIDADPVGGVADVDAGGVGVLHRQGGEAGALLGGAAGRIGEGHGNLRKGEGEKWRRGPAGESATGTSRPNGIAPRSLTAGRHQRMGRKSPPDPSEPTGRAKVLDAPET